jgi:uncharacterized protein (DUF927 family)
MGAFESLNGLASPGELSLALKAAAGRHHGSVGADWLRYLITHQATLAAFVSDGIQQFVDECASNVTGQGERVARRFGLVAVAGELATHAGLTGWEEREAAGAAAKCFKAWVGSFGGAAGSREERAVLAQVKGFFELHGASRFQDAASTDDPRILYRAGFVRTLEGQREYLVLPEVFRTEVSKGFDPKFVVKVLKNRRWLIPGNDGKNSQKIHVPGMGRKPRVYVIGGEMWEGDEP